MIHGHMYIMCVSKYSLCVFTIPMMRLHFGTYSRVFGFKLGPFVKKELHDRGMALLSGYHESRISFLREIMQLIIHTYTER